MAGRTRPTRSSTGSRTTIGRAAITCPTTTRPLFRLQVAQPHAAARGLAHAVPRPSPRARWSGLRLMVAQAFFYNAIFFTYALVLTDFYGIAASEVGWYLLPFAAGNFLGPLLLRPPVRHGRPPADDRHHLRAVRAAAGADRRAVRWPACCRPRRRRLPGP